MLTDPLFSCTYIVGVISCLTHHSRFVVVISTKKVVFIHEETLKMLNHMLIYIYMHAKKLKFKVNVFLGDQIRSRRKNIPLSLTKKVFISFPWYWTYLNSIVLDFESRSRCLEFDFKLDQSRSKCKNLFDRNQYWINLHFDLDQNSSIL